MLELVPSGYLRSCVYGERFGSDSPRDDHKVQPLEGTEVVELTPFSEGEVLGIMKALGASSAPGPDGITVSVIVEWGVNVVRPIVNSSLWTGKIPDQLRLNRTTLIPKKVKPEGVNDYRPLTIGQMMNRILKLIQGSALKAEQKLHMIRRILLPAQMHTLRLSRRVFLREVRKLDREVRKAVRGTLHIPPGTPTAFFYKRTRGGLAIPHVTPIVGITRLKRYLPLQANEDRLVASYA